MRLFRTKVIASSSVPRRKWPALFFVVFIFPLCCRDFSHSKVTFEQAKPRGPFLFVTLIWPQGSSYNSCPKYIYNIFARTGRTSPFESNKFCFTRYAPRTAIYVIVMEKMNICKTSESVHHPALSSKQNTDLLFR